MTDNASHMSKMERQRQIEQDSIRDGCVRWCQNTEYQQATDTRPYRNLLGISFMSLAAAIRAEQDSLLSKKAKLPAWGLWLLWLNAEQMAVITIGTLFNMIAQSEYETCLAPRITPVAREIGQLCRIERHSIGRRVWRWTSPSYCCRAIKAAKRAAAWAALVDDEEDWVTNSRALHLGGKLISLGLKYAVFDGKPIFEEKAEEEELKTMLRIGLTEVAETWIGEQTPEALDLFRPIHKAMVVEPRPWTSLSEGGYWFTPMTFCKRQTGKSAETSGESRPVVGARRRERDAKHTVPDQ